MNTRISYDYDAFKFMNGNREIDPSRVKTIINSISKRGWLCQPVIVNENMEIVDGQGRFCALRELGMPIEYVIEEGADIDDVISLNISSKRWTIDDYITSYANRGNINYINLRQLLDKYRSSVLSLNSILAVLNIIDKSIYVGGSGNSLLRRGIYCLPQETAERSEALFDWLVSQSDFIKLVTVPQRVHIVRAMAFARHRSSANKRQLDKVLNRVAKSGKHVPSDGLNVCLDYLSDIYNTRLPHSLPRLYLRKEYDDWDAMTINKREVKK